ncbi:MAG: D-aminoacylase [Bacillota bacterium]
MTDDKLIIRDAIVIDGTGEAGYRGDVLIRGGLIEEIGHVGASAGARVIEADGLVLTPGFIDTHSHLDFTLLENPGCTNLVLQGITLAVGGNCGTSAAPADENMSRYSKKRGRGGWKGTLGEWFSEIARRGIGINVASHVGQGNLRTDVMGVDAVNSPTGEQIEQMRAILRDALRDGAFGLSTGRDYVPGCYSTPEEIAEVAKELTDKPGAFYASHLLDEADGLVEATAEALDIGKSAKVPTLLSHHKAVVPKNRGLTQESLALVDRTLAEGYDVRLDVYPYDYSATIHLIDMLPGHLMQRGKEEIIATLEGDGSFAPIAEQLHSGYPGWTSALADFDWGYTVVASPGHPEIEGKTVGEVAGLWGVDPAEAVRRLVLSDGGRSVCSLTMDEEDVTRVISHPRAAICTDSAAMDTPDANFRDSVHPRSYGSYPRLFRRYVRELEVLALEEAVHRCTGLPASWLGLEDRGILRAGSRADLVLFDPDGISDEATLEHPTEPPRGISLVMVNGVVVAESGRHTGALPGIIIRRK